LRDYDVVEGLALFAEAREPDLDHHDQCETVGSIGNSYGYFIRPTFAASDRRLCGSAARAKI
jgi:hypothetical protein